MEAGVSAVGDYAFSGCTNLTTPPTLAKNTIALAPGCYRSMFASSGLTSAPSLPAQTLAENCYDSMFKSCTGLSHPPALPATTLAKYCYYSMFADSGLTHAPTLSARILAPSCYKCMFLNCRSLIGDPEGVMPVIRAETAAESALYQMFDGCTSLTAIKIAFKADPDDADAYLYWADNVATPGTLFVPTGSTVEDMVPDGWEKVEYEP